MYHKWVTRSISYLLLAIGIIQATSKDVRASDMSFKYQQKPYPQLESTKRIHQSSELTLQIYTQVLLQVPCLVRLISYLLQEWQ